MARTRFTEGTLTAGNTENGWRLLFRIGAVVGLLTAAALVDDIALSGMGAVPTTAEGWLAQLRDQPWLGLRNLDLLNATVAVIGLPFYLAICGAQRHAEPALSALGMLLVAVGATLFLAGNVALPMLELAGDCTDNCTAAAEALLARGEHGSLGILPGFLLSSIGTLVVAWTMLRTSVFGRLSAWLGLIGSTALLVYTVVVTAGGEPGGPQGVVMALALVGGVLALAWQVRVSLRLWVLGRAHGRPGAPSDGAG